MSRSSIAAAAFAFSVGLASVPAMATRQEDRQKVSIELAICAVANERLSGASEWESEQRETFAKAELYRGFIERYNMMRKGAYMYYWKIANKVLDGSEEYRSDPKAFVTWCNKQSDGTNRWASNAALDEQQEGDTPWHVPME